MPALSIAVLAVPGIVFVELVFTFQGAKPMSTGMDGSRSVHESPITPVAIPFVVVWSWIAVLPALVVESMDWM